jgi:monomeric sarcosine oxidase
MAQDNSPPPSGTRFDIIIIGGGTIGLSAAYYAAARGRKTLLLEQHHQFAHPHASSGGHSRFFRIMHSSAYLAKLAESALALWQEIETASERKILKPQPLIFYGVSGITPEGDLGKMKEILADLGLPYQWYEPGTALAKAFPVFKAVPDNYIGLVQPNSAVIRTKRSIAAFCELAAHAGATLLTGQRVAVSSTKGVYEVTCAAGIYSAHCLILAPSAWTNRVLQPFGIQLDLAIWQMTVAYFQAQVNKFDYPFWYEFGPVERSKRFTLNPRVGLTKLDADDAHQDLFYGFPPDEKAGHIKVSADFTYKNRTYGDLRELTYEPDPEILSQLGDFVQKRFQGVSREPTDCTTCLYTMSKDYQMVLDTLPGYPNVAIFTGDSGRGFKFTPLIGRVLVDLATTGSTGYDISPLSIKRPGIIKQ